MGEKTKSCQFRAHVSAAPLKPPPISRLNSRQIGIPRSRERGPIEAQRRRSIARAVAEIPRSRERGPIEAA